MTLRLLLIIIGMFTLQSELLCGNAKIVSWNIRDFGGSKTDLQLITIAKTVRDFDVVAIQEVVAIDRDGAKKIAKLADILSRMGFQWDYSISNPTSSPPYKVERYAFLWKKSRAKLIGKAWLEKSCEPTFYREPYLARFNIDNEVILISNFHSRKWDDNPEEEIKCFYKFQDLYPEDCLVIAGDWNTDTSNEVFIPLWNQGFRPNFRLEKTTLKNKCKNGVYRHRPIDFILYEEDEFILEETGIVDFVKRCEDLTEMKKISDHLPVYVHLKY